jgi:molecular chaperone DnaK (HSP70)
MNQCITQAKITKNEIDDVVLVGGSTNVPKIRELVKEFFDGRVNYPPFV